MKKDSMVIEFADGTKGLLSMETIKGRVDVKSEYADVRVYYYTEHVNNKWVVKRCNGGFCYDAVIIAEKTTRKEAIAEIILDVRENQAITANTFCETYKGYTITGNERTGFVALDIHGHFSSKVYKTEEEAIVDIEKDIADSVLIEEPENENFPTPSDEPKTEEEEEAAAEHFGEQMSESEPEYMGIEYTDALHMDNWKKYLLDTLYEGDEKHAEIYIVVSEEYAVTGWFWYKKDAKQFHRLHGGKIFKVTSALFYLQNIYKLYQEIIRSFDIDGISITSQLINNGYRVSENNSPIYIFDCFNEYCWLYETDALLRKHFGINYSVTLTTYLKLSRNALEEKKDTEKTLLGFCMNMLYLIDYAIFMFLTSVIEKEGENNDNC